MAVIDGRGAPPYRTLGVVAVVLVLAAVSAIYLQFRGQFSDTTRVTMIADRAGLVMEPGSKVTYNGVPIGRVATVQTVDHDGSPKAKLSLEVDRRYLDVVPANATADIQASTVFGNKYVALSAPKHPVAQRLSGVTEIHAGSVTTELNSLFETITSIAEKVDPVKLNQTLAAAAQALDGLGDKFGRSIVDGNTILNDLNPQMPQIHTDTAALADLADKYASASPDLWDFLNHAITTAHTVNDQQGDLDTALMSAIGFGYAGADVLNRGGPYLARGAQDSVPTSQLLDEYSPEIFCTIRKYHDNEPKVSAVSGGNGYSASTNTEIMGAGNPYVYPDNLPRTNAHGGPEGRPGCWQDLNPNLWPAPYLVMDTGASIAPYNHLEFGQPMLTDYVWGRQIGEYTINP